MFQIVSYGLYASTVLSCLVFEAVCFWEHAFFCCQKIKGLRNLNAPAFDGILAFFYNLWQLPISRKRRLIWLVISSFLFYILKNLFYKKTSNSIEFWIRLINYINRIVNVFLLIYFNCYKLFFFFLLHFSIENSLAFWKLLVFIAA